MSVVERLALDRHLAIVLEPSKMSARLRFTKAEEDFACTEESLRHFLHDQNVRHGLLDEAIRSFVASPENYFFDEIEIARGTSPIDGVDGTIEFMFDKEEEARPMEREDGRVDYKELIRLKNVGKGQLLARRHPTRPGTPGTAVTGEEVPFKPGKEARFKVGKNVVTDEKQTSMYATIEGMVSQTDNGKINVFTVYEVHGDVDYSSGNIDFVGTVVIRGSVLPGFRVKAAGDIRVQGGVEGAELFADGSIEITGGVIGYHKGIVKAGMNIKSSFIQDGNVEAGEDIIVSQSIMHSEIRAGKNVVCSGSKGLIVGGHIQAGETVTARTVGNTMATATAIEVGVLPNLRNELADLHKRLRETAENMQKTTQALGLLDQMAHAGTLNADKLALRAKLNVTKRQQEQERAYAKERIFEIEHILEDTGRARVVVNDTIYGGAKVVIGRYTKFVKETTHRVSFQYLEGDIVMSVNH
nr:FapA family protein [Saccharibacillus deserti]